MASAAFLERWGAAVREGQTSLAWKRQEVSFNAGQSTRQIPSAVRTLPDQPQPTKNQQQKTREFSDHLKIWPEVILKSLQSGHSGGMRLYFLARMLDRPGRGVIDLDELFNFTRGLGIGERKRQRWLKDAVEIGLFVQHTQKRSLYFLAGLAGAALAIGADRVGLPAEISAGDFISPGWRSIVWAAYLTAFVKDPTNDHPDIFFRPISQASKREITGVSERTQYNYQRTIPGGKAIKNFADRGRARPGLAQGMKDELGLVIFEHKGRIIQRLPDSRVIPENVASHLNIGRSRKAQSRLNALYKLAQGNVTGGDARLFCENARQMKSTMRQKSRSDSPRWKAPEVFQRLAYTYTPKGGFYTWQMVPV